MQGGTQSTAVIYNSHPFSNDDRVRLVLRRHTEWGQNAFLFGSGKGFVCKGTCTLPATVDGKATGIKAFAPPSGEPALMISNDKAFIAMLEKAKKITLTVTRKDNDRKEDLVYEVGGFDAGQVAAAGQEKEVAGRCAVCAAVHRWRAGVNDVMRMTNAMMLTIRDGAVLLARAVPACRAPSARHSAGPTTRRQPGPDQRSFRFYNDLWSWEPLGRDLLVVYTRPNQAWLLTVGGCTDLEFTNAIGLTSNMHEVSVGFDKVLTGRHDFPCTITRIRPVDVAHLKAQAGRTAQHRGGSRVRMRRPAATRADGS